MSEPATREASFIFCEIANQTDLIDELPAAVCAQLTREFTDYASERFLQEGGYLHGADGEGVRVLFGFPNASEKHALEAARAALAFRASFRQAAAAKPESLGKIDLRIGLSSGVVMATRRDDSSQSDIVVSGEPFEVARRLARVNQIYGSRDSAWAAHLQTRRAKRSWRGRLIFSAARWRMSGSKFTNCSA